MMHSESAPGFDRENVDSVLAALSLTSVNFGDYAVVMRSEFDLSVAGEPYIALMLLLNVKSGKF